MDRLKLASSSLGERLKTGGAQMSRLVSTKMKEILQSPTPESKMVDEATSEALAEPNWGMNLRICAMINSEEFSGGEVVKAIKRKISGKSGVSQRLSLDLLEACTSNCEKVFSEVASEKVLEEMVRMVRDGRTEEGCREKALQLIRAWGEAEDLMYLPVFRQTYMSLKTRGPPAGAPDGNFPPMQNTLETYMNQPPMSRPERYPIPDEGLHSAQDTAFPYAYGGQSVEEKKEFLLITRNSLDLLSSILNSETEPKPIRDDLTVSLFEKCKQSLPVVQRIAESTTDDEIMLFEALNLHDELQEVISRCEQIEAAQASAEEPIKTHDTTQVLPLHEGNNSGTTRADSPKSECMESKNDIKPPGSPKEEFAKPGSDKEHENNGSGSSF
ncbi:hypothetical protein RJ639_040542 [Escallonia herrerae]|uniref:Target of Myb protein 1 n=1 Tax=Escallonia herrerae TaxID=1293975 RepID=A0AA88WIB5_9ASTE|nr:hypothetical protein RJ639_040542 [Escallonia herrerae]